MLEGFSVRIDAISESELEKASISPEYVGI